VSQQKLAGQFWGPSALGRLDKSGMLLVDSLQGPHQPRNADTEGFAIQNKKSVLSQENRAMPHYLLPHIPIPPGIPG